MDEKEIDTTKTAISGLFYTKRQNKAEKYHNIYRRYVNIHKVRFHERNGGFTMKSESINRIYEMLKNEFSQ